MIPPKRIVITLNKLTLRKGIELCTNTEEETQERY